MRLITDSYLAWMHVYLAWTSKEMHMDFDVFGLSNTSTYVGMQWLCGDDAGDLPPHILMRIWFNTSDLTQWSGLVTRIASDLGRAPPKYHCTLQSIINLWHLPPWMKNQHGLNEENTFIGKKIISQLSACDMTHVVSLDTNNQAKVFKESGDMSEKLFQFLTVLLCLLILELILKWF